MASYRERVLGPNGFEPFPERLKQKAIEQGNLAPEPDKGIEEPLIENGKKGKAELQKLFLEVAKEQSEVFKRQQNPVRPQDLLKTSTEPVLAVKEPLIENGKAGKAEIAKNNKEAQKEQFKVNAQQAAKKASK